MKTPSKKSVLETAASVGGVAIGAMASRAGMAMIHEDSAATGSDAAKYMKRGALVLAGGLLAVFVPNTGGLNSAIKGAGFGVAAMQVVDAVADFSAKNETTSALATGTKIQKIAAKGLGLGCPGSCGGEGLGKPRRYGRSGSHRLRMPIEIPGELVADAPISGFEAKFLAAQQKAA